MTAQENLDYLQQKNISLCFHGHSHTPGVFARDQHRRDSHRLESEIDLTGYKHMLVCPGSVGQPRNGVPAAQCAVYDSEKRVVEFVNLAYPYQDTIDKMQRQGLPEALWQRLLIGK